MSMRWHAIVIKRLTARGQMAKYGQSLNSITPHIPKLDWPGSYKEMQ